ncbi:MAG: M20/M25/M40 family metallo-hydrolase [Chloroflexi bacterium]|nr:M20/M25/M40 family metallo-hydrolase [Chloroflexota bacterium]
MPLLNLTAITQETIHHLQALLRLDTTNPPGNEMIAAEYLARVLKAEGVEPIVLESAPGRGNVVARLKGTGGAPPLLLYGHTDVVPAEPEHWTHPPFGGEIADGFIWGRGAVDMKGTVAQQLMVFLLLKRNGVALKRDVIFAATADEEIGGEDSYGIAWLVKHHPELIRAEFGLTELGGYNMDFAGAQLYPIQVAEKGTCWLKVRAKGRPGHASQPHDDNAVVHLARAVDRLASRGLPYHLCDAATGFLDAASAAVEESFRPLLQGLKTPEDAALILNGVLKKHELHPFFNAILHNTATPTGLAAGYKTNVIPSQAEVTIDGRTLPGFDPESFIAELKSVLGENFEYEVNMVSPPLETPHDTALFDLMVSTLRAHDPGARPVPYMMTGATDAKYLSKLGVPSYGFAPMKMPPAFNFTELFHAHDERAPVDGLGWGAQVLYDVVAEYCKR